LLAGVTNVSEEWGLQPINLAVIETDGSMEAVDTLKTAYPGASHLALDIFRHPMEDLYQNAKVMERQRRWANLCETCKSCPVVHVCGGGYYPDRYSRHNGFQNPSVYCADLKKLIYHIHSTVNEDLASLV